MAKNNFPFIMKSLAIVSVLGTLLFILFYWHRPEDWILTCAISFGTTAYHFVMRLIVGYVVPRATNYDFNYQNSWFQPRKWEFALYKKLNVKRWKSKLPTYAPEQFSLEIQSPYRVIQNMCGAEIVHEIIMVLSFLPLVTVPFLGAFPVFLITSLVAALYDSIFVIAQRYNRPRLIRIFEKQEAKCP